MTSVFDAHVYVGPALFEGRGLSDDGLAALMAQAADFGACLIPAKPYAYHYPAANARLESLAQDLPQAVTAVRVDPWRHDAIDEVHRSDARALFLHPMEEQFYPNTEPVRRLVEAAEDRGKVVMIAAGYLPFSHAAEILPLVRDFPELPFVLTHGAQINISGLHLSEAWEIFEACENAYFETSGIYREDYIERAVRELGAERVLFGSGTPVYDPRFERARIDHLDIDEPSRALILGDNARRLFGLRDASEAPENP